MAILILVLMVVHDACRPTLAPNRRYVPPSSRADAGAGPGNMAKRIPRPGAGDRPGFGSLRSDG